MDSLFDLEQVLRSKKVQMMTPQEMYLMQTCKVRAKRDFFAGSCIGSLAAYLGTKWLPWQPRVLLSAGAGATCGVWLLMKSLDSSVDHLLSLQGTRVQGELANIMLNKHRNDPWVQQRIFKYFYPEVVYNDSSVDKPLYRWRYRNFFGDPVTPQSKSDSEETDSKENDVKMTTNTTEPKKAYVNAVECDDAVESPFDLVLGVPECAEDGPEANAPRSVSMSRRETRRVKRLRRRRRLHQQEESEI